MSFYERRRGGEAGELFCKEQCLSFTSFFLLQQTFFEQK